MARSLGKVAATVAVLVIALGAAVEAGFWGPATAITAVNSTGSDIRPTFSPDGNTMYFYSNRGPDYDIYQSTRIGSVWQAPTPITAINSTPYREEFPFVSYDGTTLYFCSNRTGGYGGYDLYSSTYSGAAWGVPVNLGSTVNSANDERSPSISPDGLRLYYSSGSSSDLDFDFFERATTSSPWVPRSGADEFVSVNTSGLQFFQCMSLDGKLLYYATGNYSYRSVWDGSKWSAGTPLSVGGNTSATRFGAFFDGEYGTLYIGQYAGSRRWEICESQWVPEPTSLLLLGAGLLPLLRRRSRKP